MNSSESAGRSSIRSRLVRVSLGLLSLTAACSNVPAGHGIAITVASPPAVSQYQPEAARREGGSVVIGDWESPTNFSPLFNDEVPAAEIDSLLYSGLVRLDAKLRPVADLAVRVPTPANGDVVWDRNSQRMDVSYQLRPGLRWSDGQPLTASDVAFTWRTIVDPRSAGALSPDGYQAISRIDIHDPLRFTLHFDRIYPEYLDLFPAVLPEHRLGNVAVDHLSQDGFWARPDVTSGPYKIAELVADDHVMLVRNEAWTQGRGGRRPHLDSIVYRIYPEVGQLLDAARAGRLQLALEVPDDQLATLTNTGPMLLQQQSALAYEQVTFNQADPNPKTGRSPPWKNDLVLLRALRASVDREALVKTRLAGKARLAQSPISSLLPDFHDADSAPRYDPGGAVRALDADGWLAGTDGIRVKNGRRLSFTLTTALGNSLAGAVRDDLITQWRRVGAEVIPAEAHPGDFFSGYAQGGLLERGQFEAGLWTWSTSPDPDGVYPLQHSSQIPSDANQGHGSNFGHFNLGDIDRGLDRGRQTLTPGERVRYYREFERAYFRLAAELPLFERVQLVLASPRLHNLEPNSGPNTTLWNAADWWLE